MGLYEVSQYIEIVANSLPKIDQFPVADCHLLLQVDDCIFYFRVFYLEFRADSVKLFTNLCISCEVVDENIL